MSTKLAVAEYSNQVLKLQLPEIVAQTFVSRLNDDGGEGRVADVPEGAPYMTLSFSYPNVLYGTGEFVVTFIWETRTASPQVVTTTDSVRRTLVTRNGFVLSIFRDEDAELVWMTLEELAKEWARCLREAAKVS